MGAVFVFLIVLQFVLGIGMKRETAHVPQDAKLVKENEVVLPPKLKPQ